MSGKGMAPKAGYNHAAYEANYDKAFGKKDDAEIPPWWDTDEMSREIDESMRRKKAEIFRDATIKQRPND
jgi:hypothetical protein